MPRSDEFDDKRIDSSAWTGLIPGKRQKPKAATKRQLVLGAVFLQFMVIYSWIQMFNFFTSGSIAIRRGYASFAERPIAFTLHFLLWFAFASVSGWMMARFIASREARRAVVARLKKIWHEAR